LPILRAVSILTFETGFVKVYFNSRARAKNQTAHPLLPTVPRKPVELTDEVDL
jgi:hypothetical protein